MDAQKGMKSYVSVSYTHLDVYKRQELTTDGFNVENHVGVCLCGMPTVWATFT